MNKSKLRKEYEAMFGVVDGTLRLYDTTGNEIYYEDSDGWWSKQEYDAKGNMIYRETSGGWWVKREFDAEGNEIYYEDSRYGVGLDKRPCSGKVFIDEQSGKKFKMMEIK
tara:strand:- start:23 stop:352 length:330 start_codon:yes stop_codon:yes gene_type:complete